MQLSVVSRRELLRRTCCGGRDGVELPTIVPSVVLGRGAPSNCVNLAAIASAAEGPTTVA